MPTQPNAKVLESLNKDSLVSLHQASRHGARGNRGTNGKEYVVVASIRGAGEEQQVARHETNLGDREQNIHLRNLLIRAVFPTSWLIHMKSNCVS
jgi:hypothetical protein